MTSRTHRTPPPAEFTALLALSIALAALGIDILLPAFGAIRAELGLPADSTAVAALVTAYFLGLALGQLAYGPLSDRFGRRPTLFVGYAVYVLGALAATASPSLELLVASRFLWGLGAAGPRVVTIAIIRDTYEGDRMSRAMSFVMAVFILVPVIAPSIGAGLVALGNWRWVFATCVLAALVMTVWAWVRLPETLPDRHRLELRLGRIARAVGVVVTARQARGYGLAMTVLFGAFLSYIASSEIIITETFDRARWFPVIFSGLAAVMGVAILLNARIVGRIGARRLAHRALLGYLAVAAVLVLVAVTTGGRPPLWLFLVTAGLLLASHALLVPNLNAIAMANMAPVAGTASSLLGAAQIAGGAMLGAVVDQAFAGTILPLSVAFLGYGTVALGLILWTEHGKLFQPLPRPPGIDPTAPVTEG